MRDYPSAYLAFDLGASSGRAIVGILEKSKINLHEVHRFDTPIIESDGRLFWDTNALFHHLQTGLVKALEVAPVKSLSVDSWAVDYVPLDGEGNPVRESYCYRDSRRNSVASEVHTSIGKKRIYDITGIQFLPFNTLIQLYADRKFDPDLIPPTRSRLMIADYFNYLFSGVYSIEVSNASSTQLLDVHTHDWSEELFRAVGLSPDTMAPVVPSGTVLGPCKTHPDVQVVAGLSHDTGAAVAAVPANPGSTNWAYISCGTWSLLGVEKETPILSDRARDAGFTNEAGIDGSIRFLKNLTGLWALQECMREWQESDRSLDYPVILEEAKNTERNTRFVDLEDQVFLDRGNMPSRILAYCKRHQLPLPENRGEIARLILDSIADSYARHLTELESITGETYDTVHLVGGGSQNLLLCQLTANATQRKVISGPVEATALGNLLIQARTMGDLPEHAPVRDVVRSSFKLIEFIPNHF